PRRPERSRDRQRLVRPGVLSLGSLLQNQRPQLLHRPPRRYRRLAPHRRPHEPQVLPLHPPRLRDPSRSDGPPRHLPRLELAPQKILLLLALPRRHRIGIPPASWPATLPPLAHPSPLARHP